MLLYVGPAQAFCSYADSLPTKNIRYCTAVLSLTWFLGNSNQKDTRQKLLDEGFEWMKSSGKNKVNGLCEEKGTGCYANHMEEAAGKKESMTQISDILMRLYLAWKCRIHLPLLPSVLENFQVRTQALKCWCFLGKMLIVRGIYRGFTENQKMDKKSSSKN